jgi:hypothetical protein
MVSANLILSSYVSVEHLRADAANANQEGYVADLGLAAVHVNVQPSSPEMTALNNGAYGKGYTVFTTASGILETDRLTTVSGNNSTQYIVKGRQNFNYGLATHLELYVEEVM